MTAQPYGAPTRPPQVRRPASVVAAFVVVLTHATLLAVGTAVGLVGIGAFLLTHPGSASRSAVLVPTVVVAVSSLAAAASEVVLALAMWRGARRARIVQTVFSALSCAAVLTGAAVALARSLPPSALGLAGLLLSVAVVVLLWLPASGAWFGARSDSPAGPDLETRAP